MSEGLPPRTRKRADAYATACPDRDSRLNGQSMAPATAAPEPMAPRTAPATHRGVWLHTAREVGTWPEPLPGASSGVKNSPITDIMSTNEDRTRPFTLPFRVLDA